MEIILKRIAKQKTYTIGRLYLFDGEQDKVETQQDKVETQQDKVETQQDKVETQQDKVETQQDTADCKSAERLTTLSVVERTILPGKRLDDKRIIRSKVDEAQLTPEHYFCDTLEPTWRNLLGITLAPQDVDARYSRQSGKKARKIPG